MTAMPIYGKTHVLILMKLGIKYKRPKPIIVCSDYDPGLTLTYLQQGKIMQLYMGKCAND